MGRGETESNDGRTPYPSAPDEMRKAGFYTFYPHAGSLASAEERQEQPASAGFFLLALSTGANLVSSTTKGYINMLIKEENYRINFIDKNDAFIGFDYGAKCCEDFGWFISGSENLDGFWFDTESEPCDLLSDYGYECKNEVQFKCVNDSGNVALLHLYNHHNGYYSHGWESSWGCEGYL